MYYELFTIKNIILSAAFFESLLFYVEYWVINLISLVKLCTLSAILIVEMSLSKSILKTIF